MLHDTRAGDAAAGRYIARPMPRRALVVIDMINTYDHEDAERLRDSAKEVVPVLGKLVKRARDAGAPVIYVNDNFGEWRSDHHALVDEALADAEAARSSLDM